MVTMSRLDSAKERDTIIQSSFLATAEGPRKERRRAPRSRNFSRSQSNASAELTLLSTRQRMFIFSEYLLPVDDQGC